MEGNQCEEENGKSRVTVVKSISITLETFGFGMLAFGYLGHGKVSLFYGNLSLSRLQQINTLTVLLKWGIIRFLAIAFLGAHLLINLNVVLSLLVALMEYFRRHHYAARRCQVQNK